MNPDTNKFEPLQIKDTQVCDGWLPQELKQQLVKLQQGAVLVRPNGLPIPAHWAVFQMDELVVLKDYTFRVAYIGESAILLEPVRPEDALRDAPNGKKEE